MYGITLIQRVSIFQNVNCVVASFHSSPNRREKKTTNWGVTVYFPISICEWIRRSYGIIPSSSKYIQWKQQPLHKQLRVHWNMLGVSFYLSLSLFFSPFHSYTLSLARVKSFVCDIQPNNINDITLFGEHFIVYIFILVSFFFFLH